MPGILDPNPSYDPMRFHPVETTEALSQLSAWAALSDGELETLFATAQPAQWVLAGGRVHDIRLWLVLRFCLSGLASSGQIDTLRRALEATLDPSGEDYAAMEPEALAALVDDEGVRDISDNDNILMRDACLHFAMLAALDDDAEHAARAVALLERFAEVIPDWPIWNDYFDAPESKEELPVAQATFSNPVSAGLWGSWMYYDVALMEPLARAVMLMQRRDAVSTELATGLEAVFELSIQVMRWIRVYFRWTNTESWEYLGMAEIGRTINRPDWVHEAVRDMRNGLGAAAYHADGVFNESWSYRRDYGWPFTVMTEGYLAEGALHEYTDPPDWTDPVDGTRFDNWSPETDPVIMPRRARALSAERAYAMPDGVMYADRETHWPTSAPSGAHVTPAASHFFGCRGHGVLITGEDSGLVMVRMGWTGFQGHSHADALGICLWARDQEAISEGAYYTVGLSSAWPQRTAAHCTVVLNELSQSYTGAGGSWLHTPTADDAIPGVPDWPQRSGLKASKDQGRLLLWNDRFPQVQVMEADAARTYSKVVACSTYRRTIALVKIDDDSAYVVDIFRVRGCPIATVIDWMLHGPLQSEHTLETTLDGDMSAAADAHDDSVTKIEDVENETTAADWSATWKVGSEWLDTHVLGGTSTIVSRGVADAIRRSGTAPHLFARRIGTGATFVAVHHAYAEGDGSKIVSVEAIASPDADCTALRVTLASGREDVIISCADRDTARDLPGGYRIRGRFAHVATLEGDDDETWAHLVDGDLLDTPTPGMRISRELTHERLVHATRRLEAGQSENGFVVEPMPRGDLANRAILVNQADEYVWGFRATGGEPSTSHVGKSLIRTDDEPGLTVSTVRVKQEYFPGWGFTGETTARLPGDATVFARELAPRPLSRMPEQAFAVPPGTEYVDLRFYGTGDELESASVRVHALARTGSGGVIPRFVGSATIALGATAGPSEGELYVETIEDVVGRVSVVTEDDEPATLRVWLNGARHFVVAFEAGTMTHPGVEILAPVAQGVHT